MAIKKRRPTRLSEEVVRKQRPAVDIEKSATSNAPAVAADLEPFLLRGLPDGQTLPDVALLQVLLGGIVRRDSETMEAADEADFEALSRLNLLKLVRDDIKGRLVPKLTDIRDIWDAAFGTDTCQRILGLGVSLPAETLRVRRLVDRIVRLLSASDFELPPVVSDIAGVDTAKWVEELKPDLDSLNDTMDQLSSAKRESERTLAAKTEAVETYELTYLRCSLMLESFYIVSGNEHLADKLRPTIPKSKSKSSETESDDGKAEGSSPEQAAEGDGAEEREVSQENAPEPRVRPDRPPAEARAAGPAEAPPAEAEASPEARPAEA